MKVDCRETPEGPQKFVQTIVLDGYNAPVSAGQFLDLVLRGFYDGMEIQRADGFVVQTGDPDGPADGFVDPKTGEIRRWVAWGGGRGGRQRAVSCRNESAKCHSVRSGWVGLETGGGKGQEVRRNGLPRQPLHGETQSGRGRGLGLHGTVGRCSEICHRRRRLQRQQWR